MRCQNHSPPRLGQTPGMDINKMLAELRSEREQVEEAILIFGRLGRGRQRGSPPPGCHIPRDAAVHREVRIGLRIVSRQFLVCRGLLLALDRAGEIQLPPVRRRVRNRLAERERPEPVIPDKRPVCGRLGNLAPLEFVQVRRTP